MRVERAEAGHDWCQTQPNTWFHVCVPCKVFRLFEIHCCGKAVNLLWEVRMRSQNFLLPRSARSARIHARLRKTSLATGTPVDAVTRIERPSGRPILGRSAKGRRSRGSTQKLTAATRGHCGCVFPQFFHSCGNSWRGLFSLSSAEDCTCSLPTMRTLKE
jgi:hypothetical protein